MEFSSNNHSNSSSSRLLSPVATLRADGKPNTQAIIAANVQHLIAQLEAGHSEVLTQYLTTMARFHKYSLGNVLLIASQKPDASNVAGIYTWNQLGRRVKKGEKGIMIFAPMIAKHRRQKSSESREESDSKTKAGPALVGFRPVYVWDVSQTDGNELPTLREFSGEAGKHLAQLVQFVLGRGIKFGYAQMQTMAKRHKVEADKSTVSLETLLSERIASYDEAGLCRTLLEITLLDSAYQRGSNGSNDPLLEAAKRYRIDTAKIERAVAQQAAAKREKQQNHKAAKKKVAA